SIIVAQVGISGSCRVGRGVVLAGQVGVADHLTIGDGAVVAAQSGLARDVATGEKVFGTPARPLIEAKRIFVLEGELPELAGRLELAPGVKIGHGSILGGRPQDLKFKEGTPSGVRIGAKTVVREYVTIHRATRADGWTDVGAGCLVMAMSHIAHDCKVGDGAI